MCVPSARSVIARFSFSPFDAARLEPFTHATSSDSLNRACRLARGRNTAESFTQRTRNGTSDGSGRRSASRGVKRGSRTLPSFPPGETTTSRLALPRLSFRDSAGSARSRVDRVGSVTFHAGRTLGLSGEVAPPDEGDHQMARASKRPSDRILRAVDAPVGFRASGVDCPVWSRTLGHRFENLLGTPAMRAVGAGRGENGVAGLPAG